MAEHPDPLEQKLAFYEVVVLEKRSKLEQYVRDDKIRTSQLLSTLNALYTEIQNEAGKEKKSKKSQKLSDDLAEKFKTQKEEKLDLSAKWCDSFKEERDNLSSFRQRFVSILQRQLAEQKSLKDCCVLPDNLRSIKLIPFVVDSAPAHPWEEVKDGKKQPVVFVSVNPKDYQNWVEVGKGVTSVVYKYILYHSQVAIKVFREKVETETLTKFKNEILTLRDLSHTNLVRIYGAILGNEADKKELANLPLETANLALLTEFVPKRTLTSILFPPDNVPGAKVEHVVKFSIQRKADIVRQITEGVAALHHHKIVHGNLKSSNVLFDEDFNVKLADFGLYEIQKSSFSVEKLSPHSSLLYAAPEVLHGEHPTFASDIFSLGALSWELFTEKPLYDQGYKLTPPLIGSQVKSSELLKKKTEDLLTEWKEKVKNGERPALDGIKVHSLKDFITVTWDTDVKKRPTIETLTKEKPWDKIHAEVNKLSNDLAHKFWEKLKVPEKDKSVSWDIFIKHFVADFSLKSIFENHNKYREALKAALEVRTVAAEGQSQTKPSRFVTKENWDRFTKWFNLSHGGHLSATIYSLLNQPYFFGTLSKVDAHKKLKDEKEGTYLVRYENGWILSYKGEKDEVKDKAIEIQGSVELSVSKLLSDKTVFSARVKARPAPDRPARYANIDLLAQQRSGGAYSYDNKDPSGAPSAASDFEDLLLTSAYQAGQTFLA
jgi:serine/threonine protein kinase